MQFYIFDTPGYTKKDYHTGKLILSRNGHVKGFASVGTMAFDRQVSFGAASHDTAVNGYEHGTTSYKGKKVSYFNLAVRDNPLAQMSFGGVEKREREREANIAATGVKLQRLRPMMRFQSGGKYISGANPSGMGYGGYADRPTGNQYRE